MPGSLLFWVLVFSIKDFRCGFQAYNERGRVFRTLLFQRGLGSRRRFKMCNTLKYCFSTLLGQPDHARTMPVS
jgi:hypothetical protein